MQQEAGGVEHAALLEAGEPVDALLGLEDRHGRGAAQLAQPVVLGGLHGLAQPREVVGHAAAFLGRRAVAVARRALAPLRHAGRAFDGGA